MNRLHAFLAHEKQKKGWRFWLLWVVATNIGFGIGVGLEWLILGRITNLVAVPLGGVGQVLVLNRHVPRHVLQHVPVGWMWAIASAVGWWLGMLPAGWLLTSFAPGLSFWPYAVAYAGIAGSIVGVTTRWVLRRAGLDAHWWWILVSAGGWAAQAPGMVTGIFLARMLHSTDSKQRTAFPLS